MMNNNDVKKLGDLYIESVTNGTVNTNMKTGKGFENDQAKASNQGVNSPSAKNTDNWKAGIGFIWISPSIVDLMIFCDRESNKIPPLRWSGNVPVSFPATKFIVTTVPVSPKNGRWPGEKE